jgi:hypothetical protein
VCFAEPERHYELLREHIRGLRCKPVLACSNICVIVERNLGFEAEHIKRSAAALDNVEFYFDEQASRTGVLTTDKVKLAAMTLLNLMLREVTRAAHAVRCEVFFFAVQCVTDCCLVLVAACAHLARIRPSLTGCKTGTQAPARTA